MRKPFLFLILVSTMCATQAKAQQYIESMAINPSDSFRITASYLSPSNFIYTASIEQSVTIPGGSFVPGQSGVGKTVIRKLDISGNPLWQVPLPGSKAAVMHIQQVAENKIVYSGAFFDTLIIGNDTLHSAQYRSNAFAACYDTTGNLIWAYQSKPNANTSKYYSVFDNYNSNIYLPYYEDWGQASRVQVIDFNGDSITNFQLSDKLLLISKFEFDASGNCYFAGTGDPQAKISGHIIGNDSTMFGYATFLIKTDNLFQHLWSYKYKYVTFDMYPEMALTDTKIAFLVDTFPIPNGIGNYHKLKIYDTNGTVLKSDSAGPGFFSRMHRSMALTQANNEFYYSTVRGFDTVVVFHLDAQLNPIELAKIDLTTMNIYPWLIANDDFVIYNHCFTSEYSVINTVDTVYNTHWPYLYANQQLMVKFSTSNQSIGQNELITEKDAWKIFPNPHQRGDLYFNNTEFNGQEIRIEFYSLDGKLLLSDIITKSTGIFGVDVSSLKSGFYIIHMDSSKETQKIKWLKL